MGKRVQRDSNLNDTHESQRRSFEVIQSELARAGIDAVLVGSVGYGRTSTHDMDILVLRPLSTVLVRRQLLDYFGPFESFDITDWRGYFIKGTRFGNIEVLFLDMLMKSAASPGPLRLMRTILRTVSSFVSITLGGPQSRRKDTAA